MFLKRQKNPYLQLVLPSKTHQTPGTTHLKTIPTTLIRNCQITTHTGRNSHLWNATEKHLTQIFTIFNTNKKRETHWYLQRKTKCKRGKQLFTTRKRTQKSVLSTRKTKSNKSAAKQSQKGVNTKIKTTHKHTHTLKQNRIRNLKPSLFVSV